MVSLKQRQSGFTIVELLIVIVIIGILATLVIVTFSGVQQRARDSERKTDINAIAGQLEAFYASKGYYPTAADMNTNPDTTGTWRNENKDLFKIDQKAFADPSNSDTQTLNTSAAPDPFTTGDRVYHYVALDGTGAACATAGAECASYTLQANLEGKEPTSVYERTSN